jgi:membrane protein
MGNNNIIIRFRDFIIRLVKKSLKDEIFFLSSWLTYRLLLAFFPFLIFVMAILGFFNLDDSLMMERVYGALPEDVSLVIHGFLLDITHSRSAALLSMSLFFIIFGTVNGFRAVAYCINGAYDVTESRGFLLKALISVIIMITFALALIVMLALIIFGNNIQEVLQPVLPGWLEPLYTYISTAISLFILIFAVMLIYKLSCAKKISMRSVVPGAITTVILWEVSSTIFSIIFTNVINFSIIYGSIAGIFILIIWLNLISIILLIGNEVNSLLGRRD